jgi:hypothetical protein
MLPLAHIIARRRLDDKRKKHVEDMSPHKVHPFVGLRRRVTGAPLATKELEVGTLLTPSGVYVDIHVNRHETTYKIMFVHEAKELSRRSHLEKPAPSKTAEGASSSPSRDRTEASNERPKLVEDAFDFYFPVSECGKLIAISTLFNKKELQGEMVRQSRKDGSFISSSSREKFLACDSDAESDDVAHQSSSSGASAAAAAAAALPNKKSDSAAKGKKKSSTPQIFYYRVPFVFEQLAQLQDEANLAASKKRSSGIHELNKLDIYIEVRIKTIERIPSHRYRVLFPLLCLPIVPSSLRCEMEMPALVRRVWTASHRHRVHAFLNNCKADFSLVFSPESPLHLEEYLFDIEIELGEPIIPECIDPVSLFVLASALVMMLFYMLTKDVHDDF